MTPDRGKTLELLTEEASRQARETRIAEESNEPAEQRAAQRRADKAAYLKEKLREREASER